MNLTQILFSRHGQVGGRDYLLGCTVLLLTGIILHLLAFGFIYAINPNMIGAVADVSEKIGMGFFGVIIPTILLISLLFYPYFCLYTKRLRDIGVSIYWYFGALLGYCVGFYILIIAIHGLLTFLHIDLSDIFSTSPLPGATEDEIVAGIITGMRKVLIAAAVINAMSHAVVTIAIDVVLGKMKPRNMRKAAGNNAAAFA
jgi:uncharacterized membrane protein YhaH (DUF805 family)